MSHLNPPIEIEFDRLLDSIHGHIFV